MDDMNDTYKTINTVSEGYFRDKGSKFYAFAYHVEDEENIKEMLDALRKKYYDARHHCYAWILGFEKDYYRFNDDGEPSGSAGRPIYGQLLSLDLTNVLVVVIRYFGGVKLGIPGLINAYRTATKEALAHTEIVTNVIMDVYEIRYEYALMNDVMKIIKEFHLEQKSTNFDLSCTIELAVRKSDSSSVRGKFKKLKGLKIKYLKTI